MSLRGATGLRASGDPHDHHHRQEKALAQFEQQRAAWNRMQAHLAPAAPPSATHSKRGNNINHILANAAANMALATATARSRRENNTIVEAAAAASANQRGSHAWEGLLRSSSAQEARRPVPIGRTCLPSPLYCSARNCNALPDEHLAFARVGEEDNVLPASDENTMNGSKGSFGATNKFLQERTAAQAHVGDALAFAAAHAADPRPAQKAAMVDLFTREEKAGASGDTYATLNADAAQSSMASASYYETQRRRFASYVQERLADFLQPRTYVQAEGQPPPYATAEDAERLREAQEKASGAGERPHSAPPVAHIPPPPQTQCWPSSQTASREHGRKGVGRGVRGNVAETTPSSRHGGGHIPHAPGRLGADGDSAAPPHRGGVYTTHPHATDLNSAEGGEQTASMLPTQPPSPLHPMHVRAPAPSNAGEPTPLTLHPHDGPAMELSTRALFFETCPHELQQGSATLYNAGTTTIYYSWTVVDVVHEHLLELHEAANGTADRTDGSTATRADVYGGERTSPTHPRPAATPEALLLYPALCQTHRLAAHQRAARDTFFMSAPMNGVVLPRERCVFAFSVRAKREGLFQNTYELLTVPPAPERIFLRLRALVRRDGPSLQWLAQPVADALAAKTVIDAQRRLVQRISVNPRAIAAAELREQLTVLEDADDVARFKEREMRARQEAAWHRANRLTFDHIPYCAAVYDKLARLSAVVRETFVQLCQPSQRESDTVTAGAAAASPSAVAAVSAAATPQKQRLTPGTVMSTTAAAAVFTPSPAATATNVVSPVPQNPLAHQPQSSQLQPSPPSLHRPPSATPCPATIQWDGALLPLLYQVMSIRDSATRQVFLEAMQVLLRAARACHYRGNNPVSTRPAAGGEDEEDRENINEVPLTALLGRAAAALADVIIARQRPTAERQFEESLLQPARPAAALTLATHSVGDGAAAATATAVAGTAGGGNAQKKSMAAPRSGRGTATSIPGAKEQTNGEDGVTATPAQRILLKCVAPSELQGFSVAQTNAEMNVLRAAEERVLRARMERDLVEARAALTALHTALFGEVIDAACDRGPLAACSPERLAELCEVQQSALMAVDVGVDPLVAPPPGKPGKRK